MQNSFDKFHSQSMSKFCRRAKYSELFPCKKRRENSVNKILSHSRRFSQQLQLKRIRVSRAGVSIENNLSPTTATDRARYINARVR